MSALQVLILNASLKHGTEPSNTEEVAMQVVEKIRAHAGADVQAQMVRLADANIPVGLSYDLGDGDEWPSIVEKMLKADIILFATPIWWGSRSSLMQRVIERMDSFDEGQIPGGREAMLNKVAGIVITGSEDGAQAVMASMMEVLSFMNFTLPPQCCTYWVGEAGKDPKTEAERRRANDAVGHMAEATAKSLVYYAQLLKEHPQPKSA